MLDLTPIERLHIGAVLALTLQVPNHTATPRQRTRAAFCELMSWPDAEQVADSLRVAARLERNLTESALKHVCPDQLAEVAQVSVESASMALKLLGRDGGTPHQRHDVCASVFE